MYRVFAMILCAFLCIGCQSLHANQKLIPAGYTFSPISAIVCGPATTSTTVHIAPATPTTAIRIAANVVVADSDLQWVERGLTLPSGFKVTGVKICYQVHSASAGRTYISQTRLTEMGTPDVANVRFDDGTDQSSITPTCYTSTAATFTVQGTITLALRVVIGDPGDSIDIGEILILGS